MLVEIALANRCFCCYCFILVWFCFSPQGNTRKTTEDRKGYVTLTYFYGFSLQALNFPAPYTVVGLKGLKQNWVTCTLQPELLSFWLVLIRERSYSLNNRATSSKFWKLKPWLSRQPKYISTSKTKFQTRDFKGTFLKLRNLGSQISVPNLSIFVSSNLHLTGPPANVGLRQLPGVWCGPSLKTFLSRCTVYKINNFSFFTYLPFCRDLSCLPWKSFFVIHTQICCQSVRNCQYFVCLQFLTLTRTFCKTLENHNILSFLSFPLLSILSGMRGPLFLCSKMFAQNPEEHHVE